MADAATNEAAMAGDAAQGRTGRGAAAGRAVRRLEPHRDARRGEPHRHMDDAELAALFPRGARDAVAWFSRWADRMMLETMASRPLGDLRLHERIAMGLKIRLALLAPHREAVRRGLSLLALPANGPLAARLLYETVDAAWYAAGDSATDLSFYSKRALLAGIHAATTLYWLDDRLEAPPRRRGAPWNRRLADAGRLPRLRGEIERVLGRLPNPRRIFRMPRPRL